MKIKLKPLDLVPWALVSKCVVKSAGLKCEITGHSSRLEKKKNS